LEAPAAAFGTPIDAEKEATMDAEMERILRRQENRAKRKAEEKELKQAKAAMEPGTEGASSPTGAGQSPLGGAVKAKGGNITDATSRPIIVGAKVRIKGQETVGEVTEVKGSKAMVAFGQILSSVAVERLEAISAGEYKAATRPVAPRTRVGSEISERKLQFSPRVDVRGMRPGEAIEAVEEFIDSALMIGVNEVSILHGKGTGALKSEIRRYLRGIPAIASATDDHADRGGAGITVVTFKQ
jgi:DNA mismatch repair protein MutS2